MRHTLFAIPAFLIASAYAKKNRWDGDVNVNVEFDLDKLDDFLFAVVIGGSIIQLIVGFVLERRKRRQTETFLIPPIFSICVVVATATLVTYYGLLLWVWKNDKSVDDWFVHLLGSYNGGWAPEVDRESLKPGVYAAVDLLPRLTDVLVYIAVLTMLGWQPTSRETSLLSRAVPAVILSVTTLVAFVRFGILLASDPFSIVLRIYAGERDIDSAADVWYFRIDRTLSRPLDAMGHVYLAFSILSVGVIRQKTKALPAPESALYEKCVLRPLTYLAVLGLVIKALHDLIMHIIIYSPAWMNIHRPSLQLARVIIERVLYFFIFIGLMRVGYIPQARAEDTSSEKSDD